MLKREWGAESKGKLPHLSIPSKTAALVPEFSVEDLHLGRTVALVPEFAVKDRPWAEYSDDDDGGDDDLKIQQVTPSLPSQKLLLANSCEEKDTCK